MSTDPTPDLLAIRHHPSPAAALGCRRRRGPRRRAPAAPAAAAAAARQRARNAKVVRLTVLGTTDLHGNVYNWDYYKNAEYDDAKRTTTSASPRPPR